MSSIDCIVDKYLVDKYLVRKLLSNTVGSGGSGFDLGGVKYIPYERIHHFFSYRNLHML